MPRASAADAARTAETVLTRALELFGARGYAEVSLGDIAQHAGVTRGAVYHHFRDKEGLFRAVVQRLQERVAETVVAAAEAAEADPRAQLRAGCHAFLDAVTDDVALRVLLVDAASVIGPHEWRRLDQENSERHLREAIAAIGGDEELIDAMTALLSGAMNEGAMWVALADDRVAASARAHRALDALLSTAA
ncbi:TetR/AcrR family transcriptional regulator [Microbacterium faecale]|nr:TetR/AcrR family transcriptional regulator [Microbacterium faecale]